MGLEGIKESILKMFGRKVSLNKYQYLESKYNNLVFEFRQYRDKSEIHDRRLRQENAEIRRSMMISSDMFNLIYPYVITATPMKTNDVIKLKELQLERNKIIF